MLMLQKWSLLYHNGNISQNDLLFSSQFTSRVSSGLSDKMKTVLLSLSLFPSFCFLSHFLSLLSVATDSKDEEIRIPKRLFVGTYRFDCLPWNISCSSSPSICVSNISMMSISMMTNSIISHACRPAASSMFSFTIREYFISFLLCCDDFNACSISHHQCKCTKALQGHCGNIFFDRDGSNERTTTWEYSKIIRFSFFISRKKLLEHLERLRDFIYTFKRNAIHSQNVVFPFLYLAT